MENHSDVVNAIKSVLARWRESVNSGDADGILAHVTEDLEIIPPGAAPVRGADAHQFLRGFTDEGKANLSPFKDEAFIVSGDLALQRYTYELTIAPKDGGDPVEMSGHGFHVFQRQRDGSWKLSKDIWSVAATSSRHVEA
jgi:ketosteroid isomerase-like protein